METQQKVRGVYLNFAEKGDLIRIDGNKSQAEVSADLLRVVLNFLKSPS
jgi:thymidylate kinase